MDGHWSECCAMSIVHFMAFPDALTDESSLVESVSRIAEDDFFDAIEITWIQDAATRRDVKQILDISQLQVGFCAHPAILAEKLDLNSLDEGQRKAAIRRLNEHIDQGSELGAQRVAFLSGPDPGDTDREAAIAALIESLREACAYGGVKGISLTLETFDRRVDKKTLIGPVRDAARVAEAVRADYSDFGLLYDLSHMPLLDETPGDMAVIKEHLVHAHVGNCVVVQGRALYGDWHPYFGFPGGVNGVDELARFIRGLFEIGYLAEGKEPRPWVGFEVKPQGPGETPELIIANAQRVWRQAWAMV